MPELPDINAYLHALDVRIVGRTIVAVGVRSAFVVRTAQPPIAVVQGHVVRELKRIGKRVAIGLDNGLWIVIHLMVAGRLHWRAPGRLCRDATAWSRSTSPADLSFSPRRERSAVPRYTWSAATRRCSR
jgi:formamidopyrimidine-DNA glycosylase